MNIRLVETDLAYRKVTLHCQNSGGRGDIDFYIHVLFRDNEINFDAEYIYNHLQIEISKIIETEKDFIEGTAKIELQKEEAHDLIQGVVLRSRLSCLDQGRKFSVGTDVYTVKQTN